MNERHKNEEFDFFSDELRCDSMSELKASAFEYLLLNPGSEFGDWQQGLIEQYPAEVVDALGTDPEEVYAALADLWDSEEYEDQATGICKRFRDWAEYFATERSVELYYMLVEARAKIKPSDALKFPE